MNRLLLLNRYTRAEIWELTGETVENPIIVVGNILERRKVENCITDYVPITIVGPPYSGKLTSVLEICDRLELRFNISYDGKFPKIYDVDTVYIVRNPKKVPRGQYRIVCLVDNGKALTSEVVRFAPPTKKNRDRYKELKGEEMIYNANTIKPEDKDRKLMALSLLDGIEPHLLPSDAHRWIARNLYMSSSVLKLCNLAQKIKNRDIYWALINLVKVPRPMGLEYPKWVKMK